MHLHIASSNDDQDDRQFALIESWCMIKIFLGEGRGGGGEGGSSERCLKWGGGG